MGNQVKEEEKNERIIRGLLKLPENRRCINCNNMGPQYVCTNFWTFVCITCSGIHREFTHRVKSISLAKFTSQEVSALQAGGNQRAKETFLKEWDSHRSFPDGSDMEKLRDFIRHVYLYERYTGQRTDRPPRVMMVEREDSNAFHRGRRSTLYEDMKEWSFGERFRTGGGNKDRNSICLFTERSHPGYDRENHKDGEYKRNPAHFEVVDDRLCNDRFESRRSEDNRYSDGKAKLERRSQSYKKELDLSRPPVVHPVGDICGENVPTLSVGEPPKAFGARAFDGFAQRTESSGSLRSVGGNSVELEKATSGSLIDLSADPVPPGVAVVSEAQTPALSFDQSITKPVTSSIDDANWANFVSPSQDKVSQSPSNAKALDSVLSQLSVPAAAPVGNTSTFTVGGVPSPVVTVSHRATPFSISGGDSIIKTNDVRQLPSILQTQHSLVPNVIGLPTAQQFVSSVSGSLKNQLWSSSSVSSAQGSLSTTLQSPQPVSKLTHGDSSELVSQPQPSEVKSGGRKELPEDLFTATYSPIPVPVSGQQAVHPHATGYGMQYAAISHVPASPQSSKSTNPFDHNNEPTLVQVPMFPSMAPLQGALPNMSAPTRLLRTSSLGSPFSQWMLPQPQAYATMVPQQSSYPFGVPPGVYMGHQISSNLQPMGHQGVGGFGSEGAAFGAQHLGGRFSAPVRRSLSSARDNPFG